MALSAVMVAACLAACGPGATGLVPGGLQLQYQLVPGDGSTPSVADTEAVAAIMRTRLDWTGLAGFRVTPGASGQVMVEAEVQASDDDTVRMLRDLLAATGRLQVVPLGESIPDAGDPVDTVANPPLFEAGVASAAIGADQDGRRTLDITLQPSSTALLKRWTTEHVGEVLAIVIDGIVATAPVIMEPISDGHLQVSSGGEGGFSLSDAQRLVTILGGGAYPVPVREVGTNAGS